MVAGELDDGGLPDAVGAIGVAKLERAHAIDDGQHAAAQRRQAGDVRCRAGHRDQSIQLNHGLDRSGRQRDALTCDGDDQQKLVHLPFLPPADFSAISNPARS